MRKRGILTMTLVGMLSVSCGLTSYAGWIQEGDYWWYQNTDGSYACNGSQVIDGVLYSFDASGHWIPDVSDNTGTYEEVREEGANGEVVYEKAFKYEISAVESERLEIRHYMREGEGWRYEQTFDVIKVDDNRYRTDEDGYWHTWLDFDGSQLTVFDEYWSWILEKQS